MENKLTIVWHLFASKLPRVNPTISLMAMINHEKYIAHMANFRIFGILEQELKTQKHIHKLKKYP